MKMIHKVRLSGQKSSQVMILFMFMLLVLILFLGLAVDLGFAYLTKAELSKAVDSATLAGALNIGQGQAVATSIATNMFYENYRTSSRDSNLVVNVSFTNDTTTGTTYINISASTMIKTFFLRIFSAFPGFPQWQTLAVGATAQATRARAIIALVLDRSGSMGQGATPTGAQAMPGAVTNFLSYFDDKRDEVAMVTFATTPSVDVPMPTAFPPQPFKSAIKTKVISMFSTPIGATFSQGGLTNGFVQIGQAPVHTGENVLKAVVFFTDGLANIIQDRLNCPTATLSNFGGQDSGDCVGFYDPGNGNNLGYRSCGGTAYCPTTTGFRSAIDGSMRYFIRANVTADAEWRSRQVADDMRANHITVYSIGLGSGINTNFLLQIANDPTLLGRTPTAYDGKALIAPNSGQLKTVFGAIARDIALRLTK